MRNGGKEHGGLVQALVREVTNKNFVTEEQGEEIIRRIGEDLVSGKVAEADVKNHRDAIIGGRTASTSPSAAVDAE